MTVGIYAGLFFPTISAMLISTTAKLSKAPTRSSVIWEPLPGAYFSTRSFRAAAFSEGSSMTLAVPLAMTLLYYG